MRVLVTGSAGHLGEGLVRTLRERQHEVVGLDLLESASTTHVGSISDSDFVRSCLLGVDFVIHAATLHKPHIATHSQHAFVETNIAGTLTMLEAALESGVSGVVFSSTTSAFGGALTPKISRQYDDLNLKVNEYLYRRIDLADAVDAHILAAERAPAIGFRRYVVSATSPFEPQHLHRLRSDAPSVVRGLFPDYEEVYRQRGWRMLPGIDRVYVNCRARQELAWRPRFHFRHILDRLRRGDDVFSALARAVGSKGYHARQPVAADQP